MNRYLFFCRIKWPVMLLVFGFTALLDQWDILSYGRSWPLYLIVFGLLQLAERAAWSQAQYPEQPTGYSGQPGNWGGPAAPAPPSSSSALSVTPPDMPRGFGPEDEGRK
jgi:hypothetical protein